MALVGSEKNKFNLHYSNACFKCTNEGAFCIVSELDLVYNLEKNTYYILTAESISLKESWMQDLPIMASHW